jgi:DNA end-binding protein Ku
VHIPVVLSPAIKSNDIGFNMIDRHTLSRVKYEKTCVECDGRLLKPEDIIRGYQYEKDKYVFFDEKDFEKLKTQKDKTIAIEKFVKLEDVDPIYFEKTYYVAPEKTSLKAFSLLLSVLQSEKRVGIAQTVIGTKEYLVIVRPYNGGLVLNTMYYYDEVQSPPTFKLEKAPSAETSMAKAIIHNMSGEFDAMSYKDEYREKVLAAVQVKISGKSIKSAKSAKPAQIINLMDALKQTLASAKNA